MLVIGILAVTGFVLGILFAHRAGKEKICWDCGAISDEIVCDDCFDQDGIEEEEILFV